jgi:hypothetical protein
MAFHLLYFCTEIRRHTKKKPPDKEDFFPTKSLDEEVSNEKIRR